MTLIDDSTDMLRAYLSGISLTDQNMVAGVFTISFTRNYAFYHMPSDVLHYDGTHFTFTPWVREFPDDNFTRVRVITANIATPNGKEKRIMLIFETEEMRNKFVKLYLQK